MVAVGRGPQAPLATGVDAVPPHQTYNPISPYLAALGPHAAYTRGLP